MSDATFDSQFARSAAESYEREFVPIIGRPAAESLLRAADLQSGERVLDIACGTGIVARLAASRVGPNGSVMGLDPNPAMLAVAQEVASSEAPVATWRQAPAEEIPLDDESFDVALCGMGLQFFSDRVAGLKEIHRVLANDGRFLASLPGPTPPPLQAMDDALRRHAGPEAAGFVDAVFSLHDSEEVRQLANEAGFSRIEVRSQEAPLELGAPGEFLWSYVRSTPLASATAGMGEEDRDALERDFQQACAPFLMDRMLKGAVRMTTLVAEK